MLEEIREKEEKIKNEDQHAKTFSVCLKCRH